MSDMYVCMCVCTKSFLKITTNSLCVCAHLANKADSDSDIYIYIYIYIYIIIVKINTIIEKSVCSVGLVSHNNMSHFILQRSHLK